MLSFKDHFSYDSAAYQRHRPTYPEELFAFCSSLAPDSSLVWDCATGNGQAAIGLARRFRHVVATDASSDQLSNAVRDHRISYIVSAAERSPLKAGSVRLITVAQALHWFHFEKFFREVRRVLRKDGRIICWSYGWMSITPEIDCIINHFRTDLVGRYWPAESVHVAKEYKTIPFLMDEEPAPQMAMETEWTIAEIAGYLNSWSATTAYIREIGCNPFDEIAGKLLEVWGDPDGRRCVRWPLTIRVGTP